MPKGPNGQKRPADAVARAVMIARLATGERSESLKDGASNRQSLGGKSRAAKLDGEERSEIARKAAEARWNDD